MDGNGRWAKERGLPRTAGHEQGERSLFDVVEGAIEIGVKAISAYAFSTENWSRSPDEVRFLMGFNRDVIRRRRDEMHELGVRVRWAGRAPRLWQSVIKELQVAEELTRDNDVLTLTMCVNYGGRAELADAARSIAREVAAGRLNPDKVDERTFARHLYVPELARRRPGLAHVGGAAAVQLHALAGGLRRAGLHRRALARRRPAAPVGRDRDVRPPRPPLRRREAQLNPRSGGSPAQDLRRPAPDGEGPSDPVPPMANSVILSVGLAAGQAVAWGGGVMAHVLSSDEPAQESLTGRLFFAEEPDPRVLQGVFALMCCLSGALLVAGGTSVGLHSWPGLALVLLLGVSGLAALVPWRHAPAWALWALPLADMALLGMARLSESFQRHRHPRGGACGLARAGSSAAAAPSSPAWPPSSSSGCRAWPTSA